MAGTTFRIATTLVGLTDLRSVLKGVQNTSGAGVYPLPFDFTPFTAIVGTDLNGAAIKAGLPRCTWHFDWLTRADFAIMKAFEGVVYITTNKGDDTYGDYLCVLSIPKYPNTEAGHLMRNVDFEFTQLQIQ